MITQTRSVLHMDNSLADGATSLVVFTQIGEDTPIIEKALTLDRDLWMAMNCPEDITLTITPGDTLN